MKTNIKDKDKMSRIRSSRPDSESGKVQKFEICLTGFLLIFFWVGRLNSDNVTLVLSGEFLLAIKFTRINKYKLNYKGPKNIKWGASSRWQSSLYCPMWNLDEMIIGKMHPTLL